MLRQAFALCAVIFAGSFVAFFSTPWQHHDDSLHLSLKREVENANTQIHQLRQALDKHEASARRQQATTRQQQQVLTLASKQAKDLQEKNEVLLQKLGGSAAENKAPSRENVQNKPPRFAIFETLKIWENFEKVF